MSLVFRQVGVYLKTLVGAVVLVLLLVFFLANRGNLAEIWVFRQFKDTARVSTNLVVFASIATGILFWWLGRWMVTLPGQWRAMQRDARRQELPADQEDRPG